MADPATNIANLEAALATGELRVEVNGEMVIYRRVEEIKAAIQYFQLQLNSAAGNPAPSVTLATFGDG